jgi:hypothetical protein
MPQLDAVSYFSQFFWLMVIFVGYYLVLMTFYLPGIARVLKLRAKQSTQSAGDTVYAVEEMEVKAFRDTLISKTLATASTGMNQSFGSLTEHAGNWTQVCEKSQELISPVEMLIEETIDESLKATEASASSLGMTVSSHNSADYDALYSQCMYEPAS